MAMLAKALCAFLLLCGAAAAQSYTSASGPPAPVYASSAAGTMYASTCNVVVATTTPTSTFCPNATDANSVSRRTYPANTLLPGKNFSLDGGGTYSAPTANTVTASIITSVGPSGSPCALANGSCAITTTTPAAPAASNQGVVFHADCRVATSTTILCSGYFLFVLLNTAPIPVVINGTLTFDPTVANVVDVVGYWNSATTTQSTTVQNAVLTARN